MAQTAKEKAKLQRAGYTPLTKKRKRAIVKEHTGDTNHALLKENLNLKRINASMYKYMSKAVHIVDIADARGDLYRRALEIATWETNRTIDHYIESARESLRAEAEA